jgi:hypothetical protein
LEYEPQRRGWSVHREDKSRRGSVDFGVVGVVRKSTIEIKIEVKNAHSDDLEVGLAEQLPKYLDDHGLDGIYWVLWFKGRHWQLPAKVTKAKLREHLNGARLGRVRAVAVLDLSYPETASKRSR